MGDTSMPSWAFLQIIHLVLRLWSLLQKYGIQMVGHAISSHWDSEFVSCLIFPLIFVCLSEFVSVHWDSIVSLQNLQYIPTGKSVYQFFILLVMIQMDMSLPVNVGPLSTRYISDILPFSFFYPLFIWDILKEIAMTFVLSYSLFLFFTLEH